MNPKPFARAAWLLATPVLCMSTWAANLPPAAQDIRDIRPPYEIPASGLWMAAIVAAAAMAGVGTALWKRRSRSVSRSLHEIVLARLAATRVLMQAGDARAFSIAVSDIVRDYVERQFDVRATHRTTIEFLRECLARPDSPLQRYEARLERFLSCCDLAKFARWGLSPTEMEQMLASAINFVAATHPGAAAETPDEMAYAH